MAYTDRLFRFNVSTFYYYGTVIAAAAASCVPLGNHDGAKSCPKIPRTTTKAAVNKEKARTAGHVRQIDPRYTAQVTVRGGFEHKKSTRVQIHPTGIATNKHRVASIEKERKQTQSGLQ